MKSSKSVLSSFADFRLSAETLSHLQKVIFTILQDVKATCEKHGLTYMLCYGTLLGAIRHQGFIPWDDDVDIMMPRRDYDCLAEAIAEDYGDKYIVQDPRTSRCSHKMIKVMLTDTVYQEIGADHPNYPQARGIFIDVYPIDNMPKRDGRLRRLRFKIAYHATGLIYEARYPSPMINGIRDRSVRKFYRFRKNLGRIFGAFFGFKFYMKRTLKMANRRKETGFVGIPLEVAYNGGKFPKAVLSETSTAEFCGEQFVIPAHYDTYLKTLYGDYMSLPPVEKREIHAAASIDFGPYSKLEK